MSGFVAVLLSAPVPSDEVVVDVIDGTAALRRALTAVGAVAVLEWSQLANQASGWGRARPHPDDDLPAVLLEVDQDPADLQRVLDALEADHSGPAGSLRDTGDTVVATTRPVTDTLKLVARDGRLTGTADREQHRFVDLPIAAPLGLLRAAAERLAVGAAAAAVAEAADAADGLATSLTGPDDEAARISAVDVLGALAGAGATVLSCPADASPATHRPHLTG